jgi:hypothetical protein
MVRMLAGWGATAPQMQAASPPPHSQEQHRRALAKGGRERLERRQTGVFTNPAAKNFRQSDKLLILFGNFGEWCNGSTTDSDSVCLGSNPSSPAKNKTLKCLVPSTLNLTTDWQHLARANYSRR